MICVETSETELWHNGKMERTAAKSSLLGFETLQKHTFSASTEQWPAVARIDVTARTIVNGLFQNL